MPYNSVKVAVSLEESSWRLTGSGVILDQCASHTVPPSGHKNEPHDQVVRLQLVLLVVLREGTATGASAGTFLSYVETARTQIGRGVYEQEAR